MMPHLLFKDSTGDINLSNELGIIECYYYKVWKTCMEKYSQHFFKWHIL